MNDLLLHPHTRAELTALLTDAPHGLLFIAPTGSGKVTIAKEWARMLTSDASISLITPDEKGTITIDATRALYQQTRSKLAGHQIIIIDHAEAMSLEAQNAFLKLLEEPRQNVTFILTVPSTGALLPTILSRLQIVMIQPVSTNILSDYAKKREPNIDTQTLAQLLFVARGRPATLATMLSDSTAFAHYKGIMQRAKHLLNATQYERLCAVQELAKDRIELVATLEAMADMLKVQLARQQPKRLLNFADALQECLERLDQNGNPRAQLTRLFTAY